MSVVALLRSDRPSQAAAVLVVVLVAAGGVAISQGSATAGVFLLLGGFVAAMFVEYRHVEHG